jgi:hypothetical protein
VRRRPPRLSPTPGHRRSTPSEARAADRTATAGHSLWNPVATSSPPFPPNFQSLRWDSFLTADSALLGADLAFPGADPTFPGADPVRAAVYLAQFKVHVHALTQYFRSSPPAPTGHDRRTPSPQWCRLRPHLHRSTDGGGPWGPGAAPVAALRRRAGLAARCGPH